MKEDTTNNSSRVGVNTKIKITTPSSFGFWRTAHSHGWCALPPFRFDKDARTLSMTMTLSDGSVVDSTIRTSDVGIVINTRSFAPLRQDQRTELVKDIRTCLRLDEDLSEFYRACRKHAAYRWIPSAGAGRMLRASSAFEDIVKMMCTTNCSWSLTETMVGNIVGSLGTPFDGEYRSFPSPEKLAGLSESFVRTHIRAGYRSPYLIEFAERVASGKLDVEAWRTSSLPTEELFEELRTVKGIGPYAAGNLLRLLGHYDYLALDSWVRRQFAQIHFKRRRVSDRTIERFYTPFGKWRGLFFWLEMTRDWFNDKFPSGHDH